MTKNVDEKEENILNKALEGASKRIEELQKINDELGCRIANIRYKNQKLVREKKELEAKLEGQREVNKELGKQLDIAAKKLPTKEEATLIKRVLLHWEEMAKEVKVITNEKYKRLLKKVEAWLK